MKVFVFRKAKTNVIQCFLMYTPIEVLKMNILFKRFSFGFKIDIYFLSFSH